MQHLFWQCTGNATSGSVMYPRVTILNESLMCNGDENQLQDCVSNNESESWSTEYKQSTYMLDWDLQQKVSNKDANSISILTGINGNSLQMHLYITIGRALVQYVSITVTLQTVMDWNGTGHLPLIVLLST